MDAEGEVDQVEENKEEHKGMELISRALGRCYRVTAADKVPCSYCNPTSRGDSWPRTLIDPSTMLKPKTSRCAASRHS